MSRIENVILGDCLDEMKNIPDQSIDMILVDPPYGTTKCKWDSVIPFEPMWEQINRILKKDSVSVFFGTEPFSSLLRCSNLKKYKYDWTWDKVTARGHLVAKYRPMQQTETISVFGGKKYYPQMVNRPKNKIEYKKITEHKRTEIMGGKRNPPKDKIYDKWHPKTLLTYPNYKFKTNILHPTQKPVELLEYLIKTYTQENDLVLDFTCGSGSTLVAAKNLNRQFIGIEKEEKYYEITLKRLEINE